MAVEDSMDKKEIDKQDNTDSDNGWDWAFVIILLAILKSK